MMVKKAIVLNFFLMSVILLSCKKDSAPHVETLRLSPALPFPTHTKYVGEYIQPSSYSQFQLDSHVRVFYTGWVAEYLKNTCVEDEYFVASSTGNATVSEAHGYGMLIMCYMAGYETNAKTYFDGLYKYFKSHPSSINPYLMDWEQINCADSTDDDDSASDGDIDIAFALLLAHSQWGSDGTINYLAEAKNVVKAIMQDDINHQTWTVLLGDWCDSGESNFYYGTRSSDFITSHFKTFARATSNNDWNAVADKCYELTDYFQTNYSSVSGLMPDFIVNTNTTAVPSGADYLEGIYDGNYYYNACRFPLRIGVDYLTSGDARAKKAVNKINNWLITASKNNVDKISSGYYLNGTALYDWHDASFIGPFAVGAMLNTTQQDWMDAVYEELLITDPIGDGDYYSHTLKLLSMIIISGNYWNPNI